MIEKLLIIIIDSSLSLQEQGSKKEEVVEGLLVRREPGREGGREGRRRGGFLVACLCW